MNTYNLRSSAKKAAPVESWDEDAELDGFEGLRLRQSSTVSGFPHTLKRSPRGHRDSASSRLSNRSGEDESEWQLLVGEEDPSNAIRNAHNAGVPIPANIPASALLGGTIRKLGTKKKASKDNYDDDIEMPLDSSQGLKLNLNQNPQYPAVLRSVSGNTLQTRTPPETPTRASSKKSFQEHFDSMGASQGNPSLDKFKDDNDDDGFGDIPTIKVGKVRTPLKSAGFYALPQGDAKDEKEDVMDGLEFPETSSPLRLSKRKASPATPAHLMPADLEIDPGELDSSAVFSTSVGSSRPSGRSERSSSVTAHSPSVFSPTLSSSFTVESEEDGLEGLVLPDGPVNFGEALKRRLESVSPDPSPAKRPEMQAPPKDDFFDDLDVGDGKMFDASKMRINRNVRLNNGKNSPSRKGATTITFTNRPGNVTTRIPKPSPMERPRSKMETIAENGPAPQPRRTQSRLLNHATQSSTSSLPTPATPTPTPPSVPSTPTRRSLGSRSSASSIKQEPTTTGAQLLKAKRSLPSIRNQPSPARPQSMYARPPSRTERPQKPASSRPKTPTDGLSGNKGHIPFIPPGSSKGLSHHMSTRSLRIGPRPTSSDSNENAFSGRPSSRLSNGQFRPKTPSTRPDYAPESLTRQAVVKRTMTKPYKRTTYGDGTELDGFDDLVTSKESESKFVRVPREAQSVQSLRSVQRNSGDLRKQFSASNLSSSQQPHSESKLEPKLASSQQSASPPRQQSAVPGFARDTAASRLAREQRTLRSNAQPGRHLHASDGNLNSRFKDQLTVKPIAPPPRQLRRVKKPTQPLKLIQNLGGNAEVKPEKGMRYNAKECKWEGNEAALDSFDAVPIDRKKSTTPVTTGASSPTRRGNNTTPKPALIAPFGQRKDVVHQVGGMVFDPSRMCWLKVDRRQTVRDRQDTLRSATMSASSTGHGARSVTTATEDDDEDPFAGIADLEDERKVGTGAGAKRSEDRKRSVSGTGAAYLSSDDDWGIGEDFDVGPEFVRRQKKEEARCERKLAAWADRENARPKNEEELFAERRAMTRLLCGF